MRSRITLIAAAIVAAIGLSGLAYGSVDSGGSSHPNAKGHSSSRGARGPRGHTGPAGQNGLQGARGDQGAKGDQGAEGIAGVDANGIKGNKGDKGDKGDRGLQGAPGVIPWDKVAYRSNSLNALASYGSTLQVSCQSNEHLLYGGYSSYGAIVTDSMPAGQGWEATAHPDGSGNGQSLSVTAVCVAAG